MECNIQDENIKKLPNPEKTGKFGIQIKIRSENTGNMF